MNLKNVEITTRPIDGSPHLSYKAFTRIPAELTITEETPKGTLVYAADFPRTQRMMLRKYHKPASQGFPTGGFTLWNPKLNNIYSCYLDAAMIHPDNLKKRRKKKNKTKLSNFFE